MRAEMIKLGSGGGGQSCPAEGPFLVMCDRSLDPGDQRNRSRTESKRVRYRSVLRMGGSEGFQ